MGVQTQQVTRGFTIVEVMLFLGITGLLAMTLLGGWTTMINTQRYHDSVKTLQAYLQQQYNLVYNVENLRLGDGLSCNANPASGPVVSEGGISKPRGQSGCVMLGRLVHIADGSRVTSYAILGNDGTSAADTDDITAIINRKPVRVEQDLGLSESRMTIPWQAELVDHSRHRTDLVVVIIRSPLKGSVRTYSKVLAEHAAIPDVTDMVTAANESSDVNLCLDPGSIFSGERTGVVIRARASSQSSVQTIIDGGTTC